jgi:predicted acyl esterase
MDDIKSQYPRPDPEAYIEIMASSTLFRKGETLRLVISGKSQVKAHGMCMRISTKGNIQSIPEEIMTLIF